MTLRDGAVDLWAMAAELERQFAGYKQRLVSTGRISSTRVDDAAHVLVVAAVDDEDADRGGMSNGRIEVEVEVEVEVEEVDGVGGGVRGRMYEAYTRRRDERLRSVWRARMERKDDEVMALWAQLDARGSGRGGVGGRVTGEDDDGAAAEPSTVSGRKHLRTRRSFSSANLIKSTRPEVGIRRALSQEPPEPPAVADEGAGRKHGHRARAVTAAAPKRKALSGSKGASAKEHGSLRQAGPKPPRSFPRPSSPGGVEGVREAALPQNANVAAPAPMSEQGAASDNGEAQKASSPTPFFASDNGTDRESARAASPASDGGEVVDSAGAAPATDGDEPEAKNGEIASEPERRDAEKIVVQSPEANLGNGEITSDSDTEPSYVFIKKKTVADEEETTRLSDALAGPASEEQRIQVKNGTVNADEAPTAANAALARASSDSVSSMSGRGSAPNSPPSCSSRAQSIERLLEEDAALLRKKREDHQGTAGGRSVSAASTPGSAGRRASGAARTTSPRGTAMGFKKRLLSFGKKNRGREGATTVIVDRTSLTVDYDDGTSGRWRTAADSIRTRVVVVGSSSDAASDDTDHGYAAASPQACSLQSLVAAASPAKSELGEIVPQEKSPKAHRPFFSFRSFNCGRS